MIPTNIRKKHIIKAIKEIDNSGIPKSRHSKDYRLVYNGKFYPPKYVLSIANKHATGKELDPSSFGGGKETNNFLRKLGFRVEEGPSQISPEKRLADTVKRFLERKNIVCVELSIKGAKFDVVGFNSKERMFSVVEVKNATSPRLIGAAFGQILSYQAVLLDKGYEFIEAFSEKTGAKAREVSDIYSRKKARFKFFVALPAEACKKYLQVIEELEKGLKDTRKIGVITIRDGKCKEEKKAGFLEIKVHKTYSAVEKFLEEIARDLKEELESLGVRPSKPSANFCHFRIGHSSIHFEIQVKKKTQVIEIALDVEPKTKNRWLKVDFFRYLRQRKNELEKEIGKVSFKEKWLAEGRWGRICQEIKYTKLTDELFTEIAEKFRKFVRTLFPHVNKFLSQR
jgi:hypothetical protein